MENHNLSEADLAWFEKYNEGKSPYIKAACAFSHGMEIYRPAARFDWEEYILKLGPRLFEHCRMMLGIFSGGGLPVSAESKISGLQLAAYSTIRPTRPLEPEYVEFASLLDQIETGQFDFQEIIDKLMDIIRRLDNQGKISPCEGHLFGYLLTANAIKEGWPMPFPEMPDCAANIYSTKRHRIFSTIADLDPILGTIAEINRLLLALE
jgi:hypothetical protein